MNCRGCSSHMQPHCPPPLAIHYGGYKNADSRNGVLFIYAGVRVTVVKRDRDRNRYHSLSACACAGAVGYSYATRLYLGILFVAAKTCFNLVVRQHGNSGDVANQCRETRVYVQRISLTAATRTGGSWRRLDGLSVCGDEWTRARPGVLFCETTHVTAARLIGADSHVISRPLLPPLSAVSTLPGLCAPFPR